jgi:hypothetical protein
MRDWTDPEGDFYKWFEKRALAAGRNADSLKMQIKKKKERKKRQPAFATA